MGINGRASTSRAGQAPVGRPPTRHLLTLLAVLLAALGAAATILLLSPSAGSPPAASGPAAVQESGADYGRLLLAVALCTAAAFLAGTLARRQLGQPELIGQLLAGLALGPSGLGLLFPHVQAWLFPPGVVGQVDALAQLGVVLFVFLLAHELTRHDLRGIGVVTTAVAAVAFAVPFLLGVLFALPIHPALAPPDVPFVPFALLIGVVFSATAVPVLGATLHDLRMDATRVGVIALSGAVVTDVLSWTGLAGAAALHAPAGQAVGELLAGGALFLATTLAVGRWSRSAVAVDLLSTPGPHLVATVFAVMLGAACTALVGLHAIFGAFVVGAVGLGGRESRSRSAERLRDLTRVVLLPLFFVTVGLRVDVTDLSGGGWTWACTVAAVVLASVGKLAAAAPSARLLGLGWPESLQLGALLNCRGVTDLVIIDLGYRLGLIGPSLYTALVIMAVATTVATTPLVRFFGRPRPGPRRPRTPLTSVRRRSRSGTRR